MMTAVAEPTKAETGVGRVVRVIGPGVDAEVPRDAMPGIYNALHVDVPLAEGSKKLTLEVAQHLGDNLVRAISMQPTDGLVRGAEVRDTGGAISVSVGDGTKGHPFHAPCAGGVPNGPVFNALGEVLNAAPAALNVETRWPIHRRPPAFAELEPKTEMLETG